MWILLGAVLVAVAVGGVTWWRAGREGSDVLGARRTVLGGFLRRTGRVISHEGPRKTEHAFEETWVIETTLPGEEYVRQAKAAWVGRMKVVSPDDTVLVLSESLPGDVVAVTFRNTEESPTGARRVRVTLSAMPN